MPTIARLSAREILDSRGCPTLRAHCVLRSGASGFASIPSGASRGAAEAIELRDGDPKRFRGLGCTKAAAHVGGAIDQHLAGRELAGQDELDEALRGPGRHAGQVATGRQRDPGDVPGVRSRGGGRSRHSSSSPFRRARGGSPAVLPRLIINLFSGGKHAGGQVPIQDVLIVPRGADDQSSAWRWPTRSSRRGRDWSK